MRRLFLGFVAMAPLGLVAAGCELVFGLDDYAQATSEASTGSTGTEAGPGSGAGSSSSSGEGSTGTTGDGGGGAGGDASGSSSGGPSCPCVPEGWRLVEARPTTLEAPPSTCASQETATRVSGDATVECSCSCSVTGNLDSRLGCWSDGGCAGTLTIVESALCGQMPTAKSCQRMLVANGVPTTDLCIPAGVVASTAVERPFDLCDLPDDGASCDEDGVCGAPAEDALWCIRGPIDDACPAEWPEEHVLTEGGQAACDCSCVDAIEANGDWNVANPGKACFADDTSIVGRACQDVPDVTRFRGGPPLIDDEIGGGCNPTADVAPGFFEGADQTRLCCLPAE